jgi:hypothetical protein
MKCADCAFLACLLWPTIRLLRVRLIPLKNPPRASWEAEDQALYFARSTSATSWSHLPRIGQGIWTHSCCLPISALRNTLSKSAPCSPQVKWNMCRVVLMLTGFPTFSTMKNRQFLCGLYILLSICIYSSTLHGREVYGLGTLVRIL